MFQAESELTLLRDQQSEHMKRMEGILSPFGVLWTNLNVDVMDTREQSGWESHDRCTVDV